MGRIEALSVAESAELIFGCFVEEAARLEADEPARTEARVELARAFSAIAGFQGFEDIEGAVRLTLAISARSGRAGLRVAPLAWGTRGRA